MICQPLVSLHSSTLFSECVDFLLRQALPIGMLRWPWALRCTTHRLSYSREQRVSFIKKKKNPRVFCALWPLLGHMPLNQSQWSRSWNALDSLCLGKCSAPGLGGPAYPESLGLRCYKGCFLLGASTGDPTHDKVMWRGLMGKASQVSRGPLPEHLPRNQNLSVYCLLYYTLLTLPPFSGKS